MSKISANTDLIRHSIALISPPISTNVYTKCVNLHTGPPGGFFHLRDEGSSEHD